jgi:L,D-peptidoglycan transpeptidase YkuD (ErfK/YbiS/YcfS/YnhG family)
MAGRSVVDQSSAGKPEGQPAPISEMAIPGAVLVVPDAPGAVTGSVRFGEAVYRCALGRGGVRSEKREGDGATPAGCWPLREVLYRPDRLEPPDTRLPCSPLRPDDGWCDAPDHPAYNRRIVHPFPASAEHLWREDGLYDVVVVLGYNDDPVRPGAGSAIFFHIARPDFGPTEGCVAIALPDMLALLAAVPLGATMVARSPS